MLFLLLPATTLLWTLSLLAVQTFFERGEFGSEDSLQTAAALKFYVLGLPCYGLYKVFVPVFYTLDREKVPVLASLASIACNIIFCVVAVPRYGFEALAMGMGLSILLNVCILGFILQRDLAFSWGSILFNRKMGKTLLSALLCAWMAWHVLRGTSPEGTGERAMVLATCGLAGGAIYLLALAALGESVISRHIIKKLKKFFS